MGASEKSEAPPPAETLPERAYRSIAVIDVGSTAIRLAIAQVDGRGALHHLENLNQAVGLGEDAFRRGSIRRSTTEACVGVLRSYRRILNEYDITDPGSIRAVATSAVREASNRERFLDRIQVATGFSIDVVDEAEVNRFNYLGVQPFLAADKALARQRTLVVEVGGGITKLLQVRRGDVEFARSYRLGSLRLQEVMEAYRTPTGSMSNIMESQIRRTIEQIQNSLPGGACDKLVALGGEIRLAARHLRPTWKRSELGKVSVRALSEFVVGLRSHTADDLVREMNLAYQDAETLMPALVTYIELAEAFNLRQILVASVTIRDGLLLEMATGGAWTPAFRKQIYRSAVELGTKYRFDRAHAEQVARLSSHLFRALADEHQLDEHYELVLSTAALLHEVGLFISDRSHHKHSMYLILNSALFGLGDRTKLMIALVARYHRRAAPKANHEGYLTLSRDDRIIIAKLAAILRVADALDRAHSQRVTEVDCRVEPGRLVLTVPGLSDLSIEQLALKQKGQFFEEVYGRPVLLRSGGTA